LAAKQRTGYARSRLVNLDGISEGIQDDKLDALARSVAERAVTLVRDGEASVPRAFARWLVPRGSVGELFLHSCEVLARDARAPHAHAQDICDQSQDACRVAQRHRQSDRAIKQIYAAAFITVEASRGSPTSKAG